LGCYEEMTGLWMTKASELGVDAAREMFGRTLRLRYPSHSGFRVLVIEELETLAPQCQVFLKVALDTHDLPQRCIVIATSNGAGKLSDALLERFKLYRFNGGQFFA